MTPKPYRIVYDFLFTDSDVSKDYRERHRFEILLDENSLSLIRPEKTFPSPDWCRLSFKQCRCCPLDPQKVPDCPVAVNIADIVEFFKDKVSSESCKIRCTVQERTYLKKASLMEGISSMFGIIMATSRCPIMTFFKPMARFHLPFSTGDETAVRAVSMFLLRYYLKSCGRGDFKSAMKELEGRYAKVRQVNEGLFARITHLGSKDADKNAIILLHSLSQLLGMELGHNLDSISRFFCSDET